MPTGGTEDNASPRGLAALLASLPVVAAAQAPIPAGAEAVSLFGQPLFAAELSEAVRAGHMARLEEARQLVYANPRDADALIWFGRRTAYLGRYRDAIAIFSTGIALHPNDARMYRHRGPSLDFRPRIRPAIADFDRAVVLTSGKPDEVEPDGLPNARGIPTSTLQSNIWYHLALATLPQGRVRHCPAPLAGRCEALDQSRTCGWPPPIGST